MENAQDIYEEWQRLKNQLWNLDLDLQLSSAPPERRVVAEGDSWFDYPIGYDILDHLKFVHRYAVYKVAKAGDSVENICYGSQIEDTLAAISRHRPRVVLLSAGGNDIAGYEFESLLNHKKSGLPVAREAYADYVIFTAFKTAYEHVFERVWRIDPSIQIMAHGYGHAIPDGRGLFGESIGFELDPPIEFLGPWLRPALRKKGVTDVAESESIVWTIIDKFNSMLGQLETENTGFHYVDLRPVAGRGDWANELHLTNDGYRRASDVFREAIEQAIRK